jgi:hypothetical protein
MSVNEQFNKIFEVKTDKAGLHDFNGHFWVELEDGTVYDDYDWTDTGEFRQYFGIKKNNTLEYDKCENFTTYKIVITMLERLLTQGGLSLDEAKRLFGEHWVSQRLTCMFNAVANQHKFGGTIVFGCVYMKSDCGNKRRYICGGENFSTFKDFKKEHDHLAR